MSRKYSEDCDALFEENKDLRSVLEKCAKRISHEFNCSASQGSERDCTCLVNEILKALEHCL